jgi:hypothetical protein
VNEKAVAHGGLLRQKKENPISNFRRLVNIVCFLLGNSPTSEFYMLTFQKTLFVPSSYAGRYEE